MNDSYINESYWLGYLMGVIDGISMRPDVPNEVRNKCEAILIQYKEWEKDR